MNCFFLYGVQVKIRKQPEHTKMPYLDHLIMQLANDAIKGNKASQDVALGTIVNMVTENPFASMLVMRWYPELLDKRTDLSRTSLNTGITIAHAIAEAAYEQPVLELFNRHNDTMFLLTEDRERFVLSNAVSSSPKLAMNIVENYEPLLSKSTPKGESIAFSIALKIAAPYLFRENPDLFNAYVRVLAKMIEKYPYTLNDRSSNYGIESATIARLMFDSYNDAARYPEMDSGTIKHALEKNANVITDDILLNDLKRK